MAPWLSCFVGVTLGYLAMHLFHALHFDCGVELQTLGGCNDLLASFSCDAVILVEVGQG